MTHLTMIEGTQYIIVDPGTHLISIVKGGPVGPAGPPGANGTGISYTHTQVALSASWVINHMLGYKPNFTVEEAGTGVELEPARIHHSINQMELQFNTPRAGTAYLS